MPSTSTTSLKLDDALKARLRRLADAQRRSAHWVMQEAISQYVEREEKRQSFLAEAMASWRGYRETGRHLTGAEADEWLERWGTEAETAVGPCHG